ncbi:MAG: phosphoribosylanthranilate isomerase [Legionellales bacterium]|nr:phosphoribosylanthranilate isomerase [Legionellales bacterium]
MNHLKRTRVKICGVTNIEDANAAVLAGADAIGLVFYKASPRNVSISLAKQITDNISPFVNCVGLFVDADNTYINEVIKEVAIDTIQFHGQETEQTCALFNKPYIKAVRMDGSVCLYDEIEKYPTAKALLLDAYVNGVPGGTGKAFDWSIIPNNLSKPIILAGGLDITNVKKAISQVEPFGVDVSGGVEKEKGIKDPIKIKKFISETIND